MNPFSLQGKVILVTGASSGIGKAIAVLCSQMGAKTIIVARREEKLKAVIKEMQSEDNIYICTDLTNQENINSLVDKLPKLDGVAHCAGVGSRILCKNVTCEEIENVMGINFVGPVMLQTALLQKKKIAKNASIVFLSSYSVESPSKANSIYSASKAAIRSYADCLALEVAHRGVRVNCISPAMVWTDLIVKDGIDVETLKENEKTYPLGRYGQPADIAPLAVYLLCDISKWMTTTNINITGGGEKI